jgi:hypothetical protein
MDKILKKFEKVIIMALGIGRFLVRRAMHRGTEDAEPPTRG